MYGDIFKTILANSTQHVSFFLHTRLKSVNHRLLNRKSITIV